MLRTFCILVLALLAPTAASAHGYKHKGLEIIHPWTRATAGTFVTTVVVSMTIKNRSGSADRLIGASSPFSASVQVRQPNGKTGALPLGNGKTVELKQKGPHLLLTGFTRPLEAHETFVMTLEFEKAGPLVVEVMVEEPEKPKPKR